MAKIGKLNKELFRVFGGRVTACEQRGCVVLNGTLDNWDDVVRAGRMAVDKKRYLGVVNDIAFTGAPIPAMRVPKLRDDALDGARPDVLVIGAGITGAAIARELTRYKLDVLLVDKEHDIALHASSRNDGMVHPGIDLRKKTLKYKYNLRGNVMFDDLSRDLGIPYKKTGQLLCFKSPLIIPLLYLTLIHWRWLKLPGVRVVRKKELRRREPYLNPDITSALLFPSAGITCPYNLSIAYAENAVQNGAALSLDTAVLGMRVEDGVIHSVETNRGAVFPKVVVNAAGTFADDVAGMAGDRFYSIHPRKGTNAIDDKKYSDAVVHTIAATFGAADTKKAHTKGGGIVRTVEDNLLIGPDAVETWEKENFATARESVRDTFDKHGKTAPALSESQIITYFTGVRAPTYEEDFVVCKGVFTVNLVHAAGIQSPGLTAAPAIAVDVARFAAELAGNTASNPDFDPVRPPVVKANALAPDARRRLIAQNPDYGLIVCRCEEISRGEILDALRRPVPCDTVDGVKRRVRPGMGRCQGGFCGPLVAQIIAREKGIPLEQVKKSGDGSELLCGPTKEVTP